MSREVTDDWSTVELTSGVKCVTLAGGTRNACDATTVVERAV